MFSSRLAALSAVAVFVTTVSSFAQSNKSAIWKDADEKVLARNITAQTGNRPLRDIVPKIYRTLTVNKTALKNALGGAALDSTGPIETTGIEFEIPMPSGENARFIIQESPIMAPKLAAKFPELKTYVAQGIDDPAATARIDVTPRGFHAIILSPKGDVYVDPYSRDNDTNYITYFKRDFVADKPFSCGTESKIQDHTTQSSATPLRPTGASLRTYRLALACTGEYSVAVCAPSAATVSGAMSAIVTSINRCSAVYERDFAIRFQLINNNEKIVYLDGTSDPYTNNSGSTMLGQNQSNLTAVIGSANYDFGHVFSTNGGGIAQLGVICAGNKAQGVTGTSAPTGDPYDIDYVVHEMGHQFGANHPFNGTSGACTGGVNGNRNDSTAYEPGSGTSIMSYAGICAPQDLAPHSDDYFHTISYTEIDNYTSGAGGGAACAVSTATGNTPPTIGALSSFTIPNQTPFALTASATDPNGDTLTYCWEEFDLNGTTSAGQDPTANPRDDGASVIFRSFPPTINPNRIFPSLTYILNNANVPPAVINTFATAEFLPTTNRTMTFKVTVRDNRINGGGSNWASTTVTSTTLAGPFIMTGALNAGPTIAGGSTQTVTWNAASTDLAPVSCANVKISLSTDGGNTFPIVLAASVPNNSGSASVTIPDVATTQGRIKVEAVGNIFFDISDANITITSTNHAPSLTIGGGGITVVRGTPTPTVTTIGTASDADSNPMTVAVSNLPFGAHITPSITGAGPIFNISFSATVDCPLVTTLTTRTYPVTVTVTDSNGATTSGTVSLIVAPNPSPTLGAYPNIAVAPSSSATSTPAATAADSSGNLNVNPYSVIPTTLPGGGTLTVNQSTGVVTATTTAGSTLGLTTVRVTALDSCGAAAVQIFTVNVASATPLPQAGTASAPTAEGCAPSNGAVDPGETVTVNLPINNIGSTATTSLVATLQNSGGVTPITASQNYGAIASNGSTTRAFQFTASGACGSTITVTLQLQDGAINYGNITYTIRLGVSTPTATFSENFDGVAALPAGWSTTRTGSMPLWTVNTTSPDTAPNSASSSTVTTPNETRLISPSIAIPVSQPQISFKHRWNTEDTYDGGILEISLNGGASFTDIITAGGSFVSGPYNRTISSEDGSPIAGADAWSGSFNGSYTTTLINIPPSAAGQNAIFRWRLTCDMGVTVSGSVWRVDTVSILSNSYVCSSCSSPPAITNGPPPSPVVVGTPYNFAFTFTGSPAPTFSVTNGILPPGLSLSTAGVLSGTPTSAGNGSFPNITVTATNGNAPNAQQTFSLAAVTQAGNYIASFGLTGGNAAYLFDFDFDRIANLMEYALGLSPTSASQIGLPVVTVKDYSGTNYLSMTFTRSSVATDLTYIVEGSSDLSSWSELGKSTAGGATTGLGFVVETGAAPTFTVEVRDTVSVTGAPGQKRFIRLRVTSP